MLATISSRLQLGEDGEHAEHGTALGGGGVDALLDDVQAHAALMQVGAEVRVV